MNRLDPNLKRLMQWSRLAPSNLPKEAPFGFANRVLANVPRANEDATTLILEKVLKTSIWISCSIILLGCIFLTSQVRQSRNAFDFSPAYQVVARRLAP
jgi:hypothetical protein